MLEITYICICITTKWSDIGTGSSANPSWFYDSDTEKCTAFLYSGSEGNANRFETLEQCERQCGAFLNQVTFGSFYDDVL